MADGGINGGHYHVRNVFAHFTCEIKHSVERLLAEFAAHIFLVFLCRRGIQADGHGVDDAFELGTNVALVDKASLSVCVDACWQVIAALHFGRNLLEYVKSAGRLAVAAKHYFVVAAHVLFVECGHDLGEIRFVIKP